MQFGHSPGTRNSPIPAVLRATLKHKADHGRIFLSTIKFLKLTDLLQYGMDTLEATSRTLVFSHLSRFA